MEHVATKLTLGIPTYDDFDGLYFSIKSLQLYHPTVFYNAEVIVVDNNPNGKVGLENQAFVNRLKSVINIKYIPMVEPIGTAPAKQRIIDEATREWVLVFDSHVLFPQESFKYLFKYIDEHPDSNELLTGPLQHEDGVTVSTHFEWQWRGQMLGTWATDPRGIEIENEPFEIAGCGMGVFCCRKAVWPGFHPAMRGFGAEEMYIHEKFRRNGGRAVCIPGFRWVHRFGRPNGVPYPLTIWHKVRNYVITFMELGFNVEELKRYFVGGGFMPPDQWDYLLTDPFNNTEPPMIPFVAQSEREVIANYIKNESSGNTRVVRTVPQVIPQQVVPNTTIQLNDEKAVAEVLNRFDNEASAAGVPNEELSRIPIETKLYIAQLEEQRREEILKNLADTIKNSNTRQKTKKNGDGGCGCGKNKVELRKDVLDYINKVSSVKDLENAPQDYRDLRDGHVEVIKKYLKDSKNIVALTDDPLGVPVVVLNYAEPETTFICHVEDKKYAPELATIWQKFHRRDEITAILSPDNFDLKAAENIDLAFIDMVNPSGTELYKILNNGKNAVKGRFIVMKADKYAYQSADPKVQRDGILDGIRKFRKENPEWSVVEYNKEGMGLLVLSRLDKDKPTVPSVKVTIPGFLKAVTRHIMTGAKTVSKQVLETRLARCEVCPHLVHKDGKMRCSVCGCYLIDGPVGIGKTHWKHEECPLGYWGGEEQ